ncbi:MAG: barnase inhibitor, partial [Clostridiales bacterium]|nr:barnase inhibitor [Clostridiales bacterium]
MDGRKMDTRALAHQHLKEELNLPAHYGANLDALHDCLGEMV